MRRTDSSRQAPGRDFKQRNLAPQVKQRGLGSRDAPSKPLIREDLLKMHRHGLLAVTVPWEAEPSQAVHADSRFEVQDREIRALHAVTDLTDFG